PSGLYPVATQQRVFIGQTSIFPRARLVTSALLPSWATSTLSTNGASLAPMVSVVRHELWAPPNKRLKLTGGDRLKGSGVLCPGRARTVVPHPCAGERVARSLSAIR